MSPTMSRIRPGERKEWKYIMSPIDPSVNAGQKTGMLFWRRYLSSKRVITADKDSSIHFVGPVIDRLLVIDLLSKSPNK